MVNAVPSKEDDMYDEEEATTKVTQLDQRKRLVTPLMEKIFSSTSTKNLRSPQEHSQTVHNSNSETAILLREHQLQPAHF